MSVKEFVTAYGDSAFQRREEVVRCRDCEHYYGVINGCDEFGDKWSGEYANVEPDGFCAWGERRADA